MPQPSQFRPLWATAASLGLLVLVAVSACTRVPEIENQLSDDLRSQPYPDLLPLATALPAQTPPREAAGDVQEDLETRARRLKARAAALRKRQL